MIKYFEDQIALGYSEYLWYVTNTYDFKRMQKVRSIQEVDPALRFSHFFNKIPVFIKT